ncbi:hypothetical protein CR513_39718, partial [Mucuna pruriens]
MSLYKCLSPPQYEYALVEVYEGICTLQPRVITTNNDIQFVDKHFCITLELELELKHHFSSIEHPLLG